MMVSEARGMILYESARHNLPIYEFTPPQIKIAVCGYGKSDKRQVQDMVKKILGDQFPDKRLDDEYDAIATGITALAIHGRAFNRN